MKMESEGKRKQGETKVRGNCDCYNVELGQNLEYGGDTAGSGKPVQQQRVERPQSHEN